MALGGGGGGQAGGIRAGRAYVELGAKDKLSGHLKNISAKFAQFGKQVLGATGVAGLVGGLFGSMSFKDTADDLSKMNDAAKALGISGRAASGLFGVLSQFGGDFKEDLEGVTQFSNAIQEALKDSSKTTALFEGLSVSAKDLAGVGIDEQFYRIHDAIRQLPQDQQAYKLGLVGGTDSMKKWLPLLTISNQELRSQAAGLSRSTAELEQAAAASKAMQRAGAAIGRVWQSLVIILAPTVTRVADAVAGMLRPIADFLADRTIEDLWAELLARLSVGWESVVFSGSAAWIDIKAAAKEAFIDLANWLNTVMAPNFWAGLVVGASVALTSISGQFASTISDMRKQAAGAFVEIALAASDPSKMAALLLAPALLPVVAADAAKKALEDFGEQMGRQAAAVIVGGKAGVQADAAAEKAAARAGLNAAEQRLRDIQQAAKDRAAARRFDDLMNSPIGVAAAKAASTARSLGTFGAGSFLTQGFGRQSSDNPAKQMVAEQKKGNILLKDVVNAVKTSVLRFS